MLQELSYSSLIVEFFERQVHESVKLVPLETTDTSADCNGQEGEMPGGLQESPEDTLKSNMNVDNQLD